MAALQCSQQVLQSVQLCKPASTVKQYKTILKHFTAQCSLLAPAVMKCVQLDFCTARTPPSPSSAHCAYIYISLSPCTVHYTQCAPPCRTMDAAHLRYVSCFVQSLSVQRLVTLNDARKIHKLEGLKRPFLKSRNDIISEVT